MLIKEGKVEKLGSFDEITQAGFNIKDILDSFNQANKDEANKDDQGKKETFKKEENSSPNKTVDVSPIAAKEESKLLKVDSKTTLAVEEVQEKKKEINLIEAEKKSEGGISLKDYS
jgi:hypothetical protein